MRILHAPLNIAGQATIISRAQRRLGHKSDVLVLTQSKYQYETDINIRINNKPRFLRFFYRLFWLIYSLINYDIFHFHYAESILPYSLDLPILKLFRKKIIMEFWGSDIRNCKVAIKYTEFDYNECIKVNGFNYSYNIDKYNRLKTSKKYIHVFISSDYSLLPYAPHSLVVKQAIDINQFKFVGTENQNKKIKIIHAPTDRLGKGSKYVFEAIEKLKTENFNIEFIILENLPNKLVKEKVRNSDIIIDQLMSESHGIFAIECMAIGKPVLCRIDDNFIKFTPNLPIVNTNPRNIVENLRILINNPKKRHLIGKLGRKYVEETHDSIKIAKKMIKLYNKI